MEDKDKSVVRKLSRKTDTEEDWNLPGQQPYGLLTLFDLALVANSLNVPFRVPE